jgi:hypothetical protein
VAHGRGDISLPVRQHSPSTGQSGSTVMLRKGRDGHSMNKGPDSEGVAAAELSVPTMTS